MKTLIGIARFSTWFASYLAGVCLAHPAAAQSPPSIMAPPYNLLVSNTQEAYFTVSATGSSPLFYQWLKNGAPLAASVRIMGVVSNDLTLSNAIPSDAGLYSVIISNSTGAVTSAPALLSIEIPDKTTPGLTIASPLQNAKLADGTVTLSGKAKSSIGVAAVWYQTDSGGWLPASTTNQWTNWTAKVALVPYTNGIQACAADAAGTLSAIKAVQVTYVTTAPLLLQTNGFGTIAPNDNGKSLQIGEAYTLTAKPKPGNVFSFWTMETQAGVSITNANPVLTFVMQSGLQLTANFATNPQPFEVTFSVSTSNLVEAGTFTAEIKVENTDTVEANGVQIDSEQLLFDGVSTGYAVPTKYISPVITSIGPGKSATFVQPFKATTAGSFRLYCVIDSSLGSSTTNYSPYITVYPSKIGVQPQTDSSGNAQLVAGRISLLVQLYDEETGSSLSGVALGLALDPSREGQAVLSAIDTAGRYPPQFFLLHGPSAPTELSIRKAAEAGVIVAGASNAKQSGDSSSIQLHPFGIPIDQPCCGTGSTFQHIMVPIPTPALPNLAPGDSQPALDTVLAALKSALATAKDYAISKQVVDCDAVITDDAAGLAAGKVEDLILGAGPKHFLSVVAPEVTGIYEAYMAADTANSYYQSFRDIGLCYGPSSSGVVLQTTLLPQIEPYFPSSFLTWNTQVQPDNTPLPLVVANVAVTDQHGNPISGGSIEMFSSYHLGLGFRAVTDDNGLADLPVVADDAGTVCIRSPGLVTESLPWSSGSANLGIHVTLLPQQIASGVLTSPLGQPTGLLPQGAQVQLTAHFYDSNGNEVTNCSQPLFFAYNPVGSAVAEVDPSSGMVTILGGCGAARVVAWCSGVETAPKLVSSDCNGTQPPVAFSTFAINPTALTFSATEGGENPSPQSVYIADLDISTNSYYILATGNRSWIDISFDSGGNLAVSVDISGLTAGTYTGSISLVDTNAPQNHANVAVTLVVKPLPPPPPITGSWTGTWTETGPFGDQIDSDLTWVLKQSGNSVSGTYTQYITYSDQGDGGTTDTGNLLNGSLKDGTLTIYTDGGSEFNGTISADGQSMSGTGGDDVFSGPFTLQKQ
jgi:hypothetical protein